MLGRGEGGGVSLMLGLGPVGEEGSAGRGSRDAGVGAKGV